eukprot:jgi/Tetstr1/438775/TSEL_027284.t1
MVFGIVGEVRKGMRRTCTGAGADLPRRGAATRIEAALSRAEKVDLSQASSTATGGRRLVPTGCFTSRAPRWQAMLDYELQRRLAELLERATDKGAPAVEAETLAEIKAVARSGDQYVAAAFDVLMERLAARHSQTRLLSVHVADELFMRSKAFRAAMAPAFDRFLELSVGYRAANPLPPPAECAESLRAAALGAVQRWDASYGPHYPQVAFGCRHLRDNLKYELPGATQPDPQAREAEARRARTQELLRQKYLTLGAEWGDRVAKFRKLLSQLEDGLALLAAVRSAAEEGAGAEGHPGGGGEEDEGDFQWEDVEGGEEEQEGLSAYAMVDEAAGAVEAEGGDPAGRGAGGAGPSGCAEEVGILEALQEAGDLLAGSHLPKFASWLEVLMKVDLERAPVAGGNARRQQLLQEAVELRQAAVDALQRCEEAGARRAAALAATAGAGDAPGVFEFECAQGGGAAAAAAVPAPPGQEPPELESAEALLERQMAAVAARALADRRHNDACLSAAAAGPGAEAAGTPEATTPAGGSGDGRRGAEATAHGRIAKKLRMARRT